MDMQTHEIRSIMLSKRDIVKVALPKNGDVREIWESFSREVARSLDSVYLRDILDFQEKDSLELVNKQGKLLKRFAKWYKCTYGRILTNSELGIMGDKLQAYIQNEKNEFYIDFTDNIDWEDGQFGHNGSCWWGMYKDSKDTLINGGGFAIRFYADGTQIDSNGIGRTWLIVQNGKIFGFNSYGVERPVVSKVLKQIFIEHGIKLHYKKINIENSNSCTIPYINSGTGFVLYQDGDEFKDDYHDINLVVMTTKKCRDCGCGLSEEDYETDDNGHEYCTDCFYERFASCDRCGVLINRTDEVYCDGRTYCEYCAGKLGICQCYHCDEYFSVDDMTIDSDGDAFCENCTELHLEYCEKCEEYFYTSHHHAEEDRDE